MKGIKNKKNAFTLVELLAVIVILGIIFTIATFSIGSVINKSEKETFEISANKLLKAANQYYLTNKLDGDYFIEIEFVVNENQMISGTKILNFDGKIPNSGSSVKINNRGQVKLNITNGKFIAIKDYDDNYISITE